MYVIISIFLFFIGVILLTWTYKKKKKTNVRFPPGPKGFPILGTLIGTSFKHFHAQVWQWSKIYGDIFTFSLLGNKFVFLNSTQLIKKAFASEKYRDVFQERPRTFASNFIFPNDIILNSKMCEQQAMRKMLHKALNVYGDGVKTFETTVGSELRFLCEAIGEETGRNINVGNFIKDSLSNLISILMSGNRFDYEDVDINMFCEFEDSMENLMQPTTSAILTALPFLQHMPGLFGNLCKHNKKARNKIIEKYYHKLKQTYVPGKVRGIVDVLLGMQEGLQLQGVTWFTDVHVQSIILNIVGAAFITTYELLTTYLFTLVHNLEVQRRIYDEISDVIGSSRMPTVHDSSHMPYTQATILETFRCLSQAPLLIPHVASDDTVLDGFSIQKNTVVFANVYLIHHDSKHYDNPWTFDAERFLDSEGKLVAPEHPTRQTLLPFGIGRRQCPGESFAKYRIFMYITTLLHRFEFLPPEGIELPEWDPRTYDRKISTKPPEFQCRVRQRD